MSIEQLQEDFITWGQAIKRTSPFYGNLALRIADDEELLTQYQQIIDTDQPPHLIILASVHYLLLNGVIHNLRKYYPSLTSIPLEGDPFPEFKDFCMTYQERLQTLINSKIVQTNEIGRCRCLIPAFASIPLDEEVSWAIVEVGCSAGLNLLWDAYQYRYQQTVIGNPDASIMLNCEVRGHDIPLPNKFPNIALRIGIDLNPLDIHNDEDALWLQACVWPNQVDRINRLRNAIEIAQGYEINKIRGNAAKELEAIIKDIPTDLTLCVFQTIAFYLFSEEDIETIFDVLKKASKTRKIYFISLKLHPELQGKTELILKIFEEGEISSKILANCHYHGTWIEWLKQD